MQAAPPVELALSSGRIEPGVMAALHGLAATVFALWLLRWRHALGDGAAPVMDSGASGFWLAMSAALGAFWGWRVGLQLLPALPVAQLLRWNGRHWALLEPSEREVGCPLRQLDLQIDAGRWMLLRALPMGLPFEHTSLRSASRARWLVLQRNPRAVTSGQWHGLRLALQAHAGQRLMSDLELPASGSATAKASALAGHRPGPRA